MIYVSTPNPRINAAMVQNLADLSADLNAQSGLTGLLAYNSRNFMQLLEGDDDAVLATMWAIERDERHHNVVYVRQGKRARRECPDWSMRSLITPLTGLGSADDFSDTLPSQMELDTRILFTSFASSLTAEAAAHHPRKRKKRSAPNGDRLED